MLSKNCHKVIKFEKLYSCEYEISSIHIHVPLPYIPYHLFICICFAHASLVLYMEKKSQNLKIQNKKWRKKCATFNRAYRYWKHTEISMRKKSRRKTPVGFRVLVGRIFSHEWILVKLIVAKSKANNRFTLTRFAKSYPLYRIWREKNMPKCMSMWQFGALAAGVYILRFFFLLHIAQETNKHVFTFPIKPISKN